MKYLILIFALLTPLSVFSKEWNGTVIGILDGDTVKVLTPEKKQIKIRLVEIDAPEKNQAFGTQSKQSLSEICFKKSVIVDDKGLDKYKRILGRLNCKGIDANAEQVKRGMAWAYRQYLTDPSIAILEEEAKSKKLGLWAEENPIPPWEFRHGGKANQNTEKSNEKINSSNESECGTKRTCKQMKNCEEAKFYLNTCGIDKLDRDGDGIPCESLCK